MKYIGSIAAVAVALAGICAFGAAQQKPAVSGEAAMFTQADVERAFEQIPTKPPTNKNIVEQEHYQVAVARVAGRNGPVELHQASDRVFFVKAGKAVMRVGGKLAGAREISPGEFRSAGASVDGEGYSDYRELVMEAGAILSVPRDVPYQLVAEKGDVSFVVVRIK